MASSRDGHDFQPDMPPHEDFADDQLAFRSTVNIPPSDYHPRIPSTSSTGGRLRNKKPDHLQNLMRRMTLGDSEEAQNSTHNSNSLSPYYQPQPLYSAPAAVTPYDHLQRPHSQPPPASHGTSELRSSLDGPFLDYESGMHNHSSQSSWGGYYGQHQRPASTYPQSSYTQGQWDERPHSYYAGQTQAYSYHTTPTQPGYQPYQSQAHSSYQTSPQQPSIRRATPEDESVNPSEFGLFAEALSGWSGASTPFSVQSPTSPQTQASALPISRTPSRVQTLPSHTTSSNFYLQPQSSYSYGSNTNYHDNRSPSHATNYAIMNICGDEEERPPDEELPNYQQSQAEEAARRRHEAASRAAELEQRWAASRR